MPILDELTAQITAAQKARDTERRDALRLIRDAIEKEAKDAAPGERVDELAVLKRERKRRLQSVEIFRENGRDELADAEQAEADLIASFLPQPLDEAELEAIVDHAITETGATSKREMGAVIKRVMTKAGDRADGKAVSALVARKLG